MYERTSVIPHRPQAPALDAMSAAVSGRSRQAGYNRYVDTNAFVLSVRLEACLYIILYIGLSRLPCLNDFVRVPRNAYAGEADKVCDLTASHLQDTEVLQQFIKRNNIMGA